LGCLEAEILEAMMAFNGSAQGDGVTSVAISFFRRDPVPTRRARLSTKRQTTNIYRADRDAWT